MEARASKLRRLEQYRRMVPHVSASALSAILKSCQDAPAMWERKDIRAARDATVNEVTPYGPVLSTNSIELSAIDGGAPIPVPIANPFAFLYVAFRDCVAFRQLVMDTARKHPPSVDNPWHIVLYSDEVTPGNNLSYDNRRKNWVLYYSFLEFGSAILSRDEAWICVCSKRSSEVTRAVGGIAQVFRRIMRLFFNTEGHSFDLSGISLVSDGPALRLYATMGPIVQDGGAHKLVFCIKGDSGTRLCMLCLNAFARESRMLNEETGETILRCDLMLERELHFATNNDVRGCVRRLAAARLTDPPGAFKLREQAYGFNHCEQNMLLDPELDRVLNPVSAYMHDWCHCLLVHGVFNTTTYLLLGALVAYGARDAWSQFQQYVAMWTWPASFKTSTRHLASTFESKRARSSIKAKHVKCSASDGLSLFPVMSALLQFVFIPAGVCAEECKAFVLLAGILELLGAVPQGGIVTPDMLRDSIDEFLRQCQRCGWTEYMHPKFHWLVHMPQHLREWNTLIACFVHERRHKCLKRYQNSLHNTIDFDRSVMSEVTCHHLSELSDPSSLRRDIGLHRPRPAPKELISYLRQTLELEPTDILPDCEFATVARCSEFMTCSAGDVVYFQADAHSHHIMAGELWWNCRIGADYFCIVSHWELEVEHIMNGTCRYQIYNDRTELLPMKFVRRAAIYKLEGTSALLIVPIELRGHLC